eukprot:7521674-Alexandrium_andersonii.AAC.1
MKAVANEKFVYKATTNHCAFDSRPKGLRFFKPFRFYGTADWLLSLHKPCTCGKRNHVQLMTTTVNEKTGKVQASGNIAEMKKSQAYHPRFASHVIRLFMDAPPLSSIVAEPVGE